jgi:hypothetical protein
MANYVRLAATAQRLIEKNGRIVKFVRFDLDANDVDKPWRGPAELPESPYTPVVPYPEAKAVVVPYVEKDIDGSLIRVGDKRLFVAVNSLPDDDLELYNAVVDGEALYRIVNVSLLNPGEVRLLYEMQIRK